MRLHRLYRCQRLAVSPEVAWAFFSDPANLVTITPPWLDFRPTSQLPPAAYPGLIVTYRLRPLGSFAVDWVTEITQMRRPDYFVDEQRFGPYRFWHHLHRFTAVPGGLEMEDVVHYALPLGALGDLVHRLGVGRRLATIFDYRQQALQARFGAPEATSP